MIDKINNNQIQNLFDSASPKGPASAKPPKNNEADDSIQIDYACLIEKALKEPESDTGAVQRAKQLLLSGELDDPQHLQEAAENFLKFGI